MNGSVSAIVTLGFGAWGSVNLLVTLGFGIGTTAVVVPEKTFAVADPTTAFVVPAFARTFTVPEA